MALIRRRTTPAVLALALTGWWCLAAVGAGTPPAAAQQPQGPIRLFPPVEALPERAPPPRRQPGGEIGETEPLVEEPAVRVEELATPSVDAIGLPPPDGLGDAGLLWRDGTDPHLVLDLVRTLPVRTANPALRALARRLLLSPGPPGAAGGGEEGRLLAARIERLLAMGELDAARALVRRLPQGHGGEALERRAAETLLLAAEVEGACGRAEEGNRRYRDPFWGKLVALCRLRAGEGAEARLAVDLLRELAAAGGGGEPGDSDDPAFFTLFDRVEAGAAAAGEVEPPPFGAAGPSPLHLALLQEAGMAIPGEPLDQLAPDHLAAIARDPASPPARRVAAAESAAALGTLPPDGLAAVYAGAEASNPPPPIADLGTETVDRLAASPEGRARLYRALRRGKPAAAERARAAVAVWRAVDPPALRVLVAGLFAAPLAELPPDPAAAWADAAALGLLGAGRPDAAAAWRALAAAGGQSALQPLFALAEGERPDPEALSTWRLRAAGAEERARLLALFGGLTTATPEPVPGPTPPADAPLATSRLDLLRRAAAAGWMGETVLLGLHLLDARPADADPVALAGALEGLRRVGLEREARAVAVATALAMTGPELAATTGTGGGGGD